MSDLSKSVMVMAAKGISRSTCLDLLQTIKTILPHEEVLEGANNFSKPSRVLAVIDGLDKGQKYLKSIQSYVYHSILKPWNDRQDMFITCILTFQIDNVNGLKTLSALIALAYEKGDIAWLEEIADQCQHYAGIGYLMSNLGVMFSEKMEYKKSETCFATAKNCFEREHDHLGNAVARLNLAILHKLIGNDETAQSWCDSAASLCHDILMRMTRDVYLPWKVLRRVADLFQEFGNYKRYQDILHIGVLYDISGANEISTLNLMKRVMALQLKEWHGEKIEGEELEDVACQLHELLDQFFTDIKVKQELLNADIITTAIIMAKMYRDINHVEEACMLLKKLQAKYLLVHGRTHCLYASLLYHVGRFKLGVGKAGEAEIMLKQALEIFVCYYCKGHHMVASCKSLLGTCALLKCQYRDASNVLTEALTLFKKINPRHPEVAEVLLKFAFLHSEEGNLQSAEMTMQEALDNFISVCGEDSPKTASAYVQAAAMLQKVGESRVSAVDKVKKAIDIFLKLGLQHDHPDVLICHSLLGVLQLSMGSDEAEEQFTEVLQQVSLPEESFVASKSISPESTNMFFQVKTSGGAERYPWFSATVVSLVNLVSMKAVKERRAHLNTLLSFLHGQETEMPLFAVFAGQNYIFHKVWLPDRYVYCVLTDQGVNSDFTSLKSDGLEDPNVFLLSSSTSYGKKPCYLLFWKTPEVLEMGELSRVCSAIHESVSMLFLQQKFKKGNIDGQDFYVELALPTEPCAVISLYSQMVYFPLVVEQLSVLPKDGNIDSGLHSSLISAVKPSTHVSYFSYIFSCQRQAEFVFDNLVCSLGQSLPLAKVEDVEISDASALQNGKCFFILEPSNSSLSLALEEESVLVKCRTVKEYESSCICSSVKNTLESTLDSLCCVVRITFKKSLQLFCDDHDVTVGCNYIKDSAKKSPCSGQSLETLDTCGVESSQESDCDHLKGKPPADLLQNEMAEGILSAGQPGDKIGTEICLGLLECLLTSRHVSSEVQPSATGKMSSLTRSAYLDDEEQSNNSVLSPGSMSSLNSYPTNPSNEVCQMSVFLPNMSVSLSKAAAKPCDEKKDPNSDDKFMKENALAASTVCNELPLILQEKLSNQSVGDNCVEDPSAIKSCHEEDITSGENNQNTESREIGQLEDTQLSKKEILILKSEVEFCQNQCHQLRQQLGELKEQFQQCKEEKEQLESELGRRSFLEDKQKRNEKAFQSSKAHANEQSKYCSASGASYDFTEIDGKSGPIQEPADGAFYVGEENWYGTGSGCTLKSDHCPASTSVGDIAHVASGNFDLSCPYSAGRSNGALNEVLSEAQSTSAHPYEPGNASNTCDLLDPAGDQVALEAVVSEPCLAESASFRDSLSDRNAATDGLNLVCLAVAQLVASLEGLIGERLRGATWGRTWNWNGRLQGQASPPQGQANPVQAAGSCLHSPFGDFIIESLGSIPNSARALATREAIIRAFTVDMRRGASSCSGPVEHSCVCLENNGSQACRVHGTIVPETCRPDSAHDTCCKCLEDVFIGSLILPCSHRVHMDCIVDMVQNGELNCPICGRPFLWRG